MNGPSPAGLSAATAAYLALFMLTLVVHSAFMHYVLAGSTYLAVGRLMGPRRCAVCGWQAILLDWLPFATGLAITAGVAPLLFVQILYGREFSTANLLLSHRWMAILPVLIGCFYLLYLQKSAWLARRGWAWRPAVAGLACAGFVFIAWSWTENHLLMLDEASWPALYGSGAIRYASPGVLPRLALWFFVSFPTLAVALAWQGRLSGIDLGGPPAPAEVVLGLSPVRRLALTALAGIAGSVIAAAAYGATFGDRERLAVGGPLGGAGLVLAAAGLMVQASVWAAAAASGRLSVRGAWVATAGWLAALSGLVAAREALRLASLDLVALAPRHAAAAAVGGLPVFILFAALATAALWWCVRLVRVTIR